MSFQLYNLSQQDVRKEGELIARNHVEPQAVKEAVNETSRNLRKIGYNSPLEVEILEGEGKERGYFFKFNEVTNFHEVETAKHMFLRELSKLVGVPFPLFDDGETSTSHIKGEKRKKEFKEEHGEIEKII